MTDELRQELYYQFWLAGAAGQEIQKLHRVLLNSLPDEDEFGMATIMVANLTGRIADAMANVADLLPMPAIL